MTQLSKSLTGTERCSVQVVIVHTHIHVRGALENDTSLETNNYHLIHLVGACFFMVSTL